MSSSKIKKFTEKKQKVEWLELLFNYFDKNLKHKLNTVYVKAKECSEFLSFISDINEENYRLLSANFCKNRFCEMCRWRKSLADFIKLSTICKYIDIEYNNHYKYLFLTLTIRNVKANRLKYALNKLSDDFHNYSRKTFFKKNFHGYCKKFEITYNDKRDDYHPHLHVFLLVDEQYFDKDNENYVTRAEFLREWQKSTKDDRITQVDIRACKDDDVCKELSKYETKSVECTYKSFDVLYRNLSGKRVVSYGGLMKEVAQKYNNGELDYLIEVDTNEYVKFIDFNYNYKDLEYIKTQEMLFDEEQYIKYNNLSKKYEFDYEN